MAAYELQPWNFKLTGADMGAFDWADALRKGLENRKQYEENKNLPNKLAADLGYTQAATQSLSDKHGLAGLIKQLYQQKVNAGQSDEAFENRLANLRSGGVPTAIPNASTSLPQAPGETSEEAPDVRQHPSNNPFEGSTSGAATPYGENLANSMMRTPTPNIGTQTQGNAAPAQNYKQSLAGGVNQNSATSPSMANDEEDPGYEIRIVDPGNPNDYAIDRDLEQHPELANHYKKRNMQITKTAKYNPTNGITSVLTTYPSGKVTESISTLPPPLTTAIKTQQQNITINAPRLIKAIQGIIDAPSPWSTSGDFNAKALHNKAVKATSETYTKAKGWPNVLGAVKDAADVLERGYLETDSAYRKRLRSYQEQLVDNIEDASTVLNPRSKGRSAGMPSADVIEKEAEHFKTTPANIKIAIHLGIKDASKLQKWLKGRK